MLVQGLPAEATLWRERRLDERTDDTPRRQVETDPNRIKSFFSGTSHEVRG